MGLNKKYEVINLIIEAVTSKFKEETESNMSQKILQYIRTAKLKHYKVEKNIEA